MGDRRPKPYRYDTRYTILVSKICKPFTNSDVSVLFSEFGDIKSMYISQINDSNEFAAEITYYSEEVMDKTISKFDNFIFNQCYLSVKPKNLNQLFIVGFKLTWSQSQIESVINSFFKNVNKVSVIDDPRYPERNRGFCFVRFNTYQDALTALKMIQSNEFVVENKVIQGNWADNQNSFEDESGLNKQALYVCPITADIYENDLINLFMQFGHVKEVVLSRNLKNVAKTDFAFINFSTPTDAQKAYHSSGSLLLKNIKLQIKFARKSDRNKYDHKLMNQQIPSSIISSSSQSPHITSASPSNIAPNSIPQPYPFQPTYAYYYPYQLTYPSVLPISRVDPLPPVCRYFDSPEGCKFGSNCYYLHGNNDPRFFYSPYQFMSPYQEVPSYLSNHH